MPQRELTIQRHASELGSWEMVNARPHAALAGVARGYTGYRENTPGPLRRREVPRAAVTVILSFEHPLRVLPSLDGRDPGVTVTSFVAGLDDAPTITEHAGRQHGIEIALCPLAASTLFGVAMDTVARRVVDLSDLLGREGPELISRLAEARGWSDRFALVDQVLIPRLRNGRAPPPEVSWAWRRLCESGGTIPIQQLTREVGFSQRYLIERFRTYIGFPPKVAARVLRFERARDLLQGARPGSLASVAAGAGYYDQAHLNLEFQRLAGCTPREYLATQLPDGGGNDAMAAAARVA